MRLIFKNKMFIIIKMTWKEELKEQLEPAKTEMLEKKVYYKSFIVDGEETQKKVGQLKSSLSENSANIYIDNYIRFFMLYNKEGTKQNIDWLQDIDNVYKMLKEKHPNDVSRKSYMNAIIKILDTYEDETGIIKKYQQLRDSIGELIEEEASKPEISDNQSENFIKKSEYDVMIKTIENEIVFNKLKTKTDPTLKERGLMQLFIMLKIYTTIPPVRNEMATLDLINNRREFNKISEETLSNNNYLLLDKNKMYFVLNKYKTAYTYHQNLIEVPSEVKKLLNIWLTRYNPDKDYVFVERGNEKLKKNNLSKLFIRASKKYLGKSISTNILRKMYVSDKYSDVKEEMEKDAKIMGHSTQTQQKYYNKKQK